MRIEQKLESEIEEFIAGKVRAPKPTPKAIPKPKPDIRRSRKRCPVCRIDRTYAGPICPRCTKLGYKKNPKTGKIRRS